MKNLTRMFMTLSMAAVLASCGQKKADEEFRYSLDSFADLKIMRFKIPAWESLSLQQKAYVYHLSEAAKWGRDITWDQYCAYNLPIRHAVEDIIDKYNGVREGEDWDNFITYAKRVFFSNGIHHHYAEDKFFPTCPREYFQELMEAVGADTDLLEIIYNPDIFPQRRSTSQTGDIVALSAVNFYEGVTRTEAEAYYKSISKADDPRPISYGLNSKLVKENGKVVEKPWMSGGIYGPAIEKICEKLAEAAKYTETEDQKQALGTLIGYYRTGNLRLWDQYNIQWVKDTVGIVDYINGFIEDYDDPLGRKATWEGYVHVKDSAASARTEILSANAQWFEDNAPMDERFKKKECKGISAKVVNAITLAGACYPATPIGINLPNADWIRAEHGSKSVTIANITHAYDLAALEEPHSSLAEFAYDDEEIALVRKYGDYVDEVHTDLHECLGHGSGQLLPGVSATALGEYQSALEEARADLFGLYYVADPKMIELGIIPDAEAYKASYASYIRNGLFTQFTRVELGRPNTEAHMQNRKLIAQWAYEHGKGRAQGGGDVIERKIREGKSYFVVNDYETLRTLFGELLGEIQRIKSEGDFGEGKRLIETYAVHIDPELHKEARERYEKLNLKPYGGFVNPDIVPVLEDGEITDYKVVYANDFLAQQMEYGKKYATL